MVQEILSKLKNNQRLIAYAAENNVASIKTLTRVGFIKSDEYDVRQLPKQNLTPKFYKWFIDK